MTASLLANDDPEPNDKNGNCLESEALSIKHIHSVTSIRQSLNQRAARAVRVPSGSKNHRLGVLDTWGLIEIVGQTDHGIGENTERVWWLTSGAEQFVVDHLTDDDELPDNHEVRIQKLEEIVKQYHCEIEQLRESKLDINRFENLQDAMNDSGKYWRKTVDAIEAWASGDDQ